MAIGYGEACPKPPTRLEKRIERNKGNYHQEQIFKADVWKRDKGLCRACGVKVLRCLALHPKRGEVHHLESRTNHAVRYDMRNGLLVCAVCHEAIERHRLHVRGTRGQTFKVNGESYLNADCELRIGL